MKKFLRFLALGAGLILLLVLIGAIYIQFSGIPGYANEAPDLKVGLDSVRVAEGARMASMMCAGCHRSEDGKLGGAYMPDNKAFGEIYASNITQHPKYGITGYSDGELAYLLRTGIRKDGKYTPPWMPKFPHLSDEDLYSIIAFLRSDHRMVQPSDNKPPKSKPNFLAKLLAQVAFKPLPYPDTVIPPPDKEDEVAFGRYNATAKYDCYGCHSASFTTADPMKPENTEGFFGGGNLLLDQDGNPIRSSNLTMDTETGIGDWTKEQFIEAVRTGIKPSGPALRYPMIPYSQLTDEEAASLWAYLQTIPKINNPNDK